MCVSRESNPDLLLGRQQCWPLHHSRTSWWGLPSYNTYRCPTIGTFPLSCKIHHEFRFSLKMIFLPPTSEVIKAEPPSIKKLKRPYGYMTPHLYKPDVNALFSCKESLLWSALIHHCWIVHTHAQALSQSLAVDISNCFYLIPSLYLIWPQGGWSTSWHRSYWGTSDAQNTWGRLRGTVSEGLYDPARLSEPPHTPVWTSAQPQQKQVG